MAGICSQHRDLDPNCRLCNLIPHDLFPDWDQKVAAAKAAGTTICKYCQFEYYLTTKLCPKCSKAYESEA